MITIIFPFRFKEEVFSYSSIKKYLVGGGRCRICSLKEEDKGRYMAKTNKLQDINELRMYVPFSLESRRIIDVKLDEKEGIMLLACKNEEDKSQDFHKAPVLYILNWLNPFVDKFEWKRDQEITEKVNIRCINE
jgi:hypothetical protein